MGDHVNHGINAPRELATESRLLNLFRQINLHHARYTIEEVLADRNLYLESLISEERIENEAKSLLVPCDLFHKHFRMIKHEQDFTNLISILLPK